MSARTAIAEEQKPSEPVVKRAYVIYLANESGYVSCSKSETDSQTVQSNAFLEAAELTEYHDAELARLTAAIRDEIAAVQAKSGKPGLQIGVLHVPDGLYLVWEREVDEEFPYRLSSKDVHSGSSRKAIRKALKYKVPVAEEPSKGSTMERPLGVWSDGYAYLINQEHHCLCYKATVSSQIVESLILLAEELTEMHDESLDELTRSIRSRIREAEKGRKDGKRAALLRVPGGLFLAWTEESDDWFPTDFGPDAVHFGSPEGAIVDALKYRLPERGPIG